MAGRLSARSARSARARRRAPGPRRVDRGQEADLPVVDREDRHAGAGVAAQRAQDRAVAAQRDAKLDVVVDRRVELDAGASGRSYLRSRRGRARTVTLRRRATSTSACSAGPVSSGRGCDSTVTLPGGSQAGHFAERGLEVAATAPSRAASASQRNVSRLPLGPGSPEDTAPRTAAPSSRAQAATARTAARRSASSRTTPPLPTRSRPGLELRLDHHEGVEARRGAGQQRGQHLAQRDEGEVGHDEVGRVGQVLRAQRARVRALEHRDTVVRAQAPVQLAVGDVDRDDVRGAALQQAVGEASRGGAGVQAAAPGGVHARARRARRRAFRRRGRRSAGARRRSARRRRPRAGRAWRRARRPGPRGPRPP